MKILSIVYNLTDSCSFYRAGGVFPALNANSDIKVTMTQWSQISLDWQSIIEYDIIMMQRPFTDEALNLARFLKNFKGISIWADYDDNLFAVPAENRFSRLYGEESRERIRQIIGLCDAISVTTEELKAIIEPINPDVYVIPNAFNDYIFPSRPDLPKRNKRVFWRGSDSHIYDIMTVGDALNQITRECPEYGFIFQGFFPWYLESRSNLYGLPEADVMLYHWNAFKMAPELLIAPLSDSVFNKSKSNIAYIEAAFMGAACIAYDFPEWRKPGCHNYKTQEGFYSILKALLNSPYDDREARIAWEYVSDELMLSKINNKRISLIDSIRKR